VGKQMLADPYASLPGPDPLPQAVARQAGTRQECRRRREWVARANAVCHACPAI